MQKITIEHISRHTGLSRGTVSRALNDRPDISEKTKKRVLEACAQLDYRPSHAARSLATGTNFALAVLVPNFHCPFTAAFLSGAATRAAKAHYVLNPMELGTEPGEAASRLRRLATDRIDSVLCTGRLDPAVGAVLREVVGERSVVTCWPVEGVRADVLTPDLAEAGRLGVRQLVQLGFRQLLYVHEGDAPDSSTQLGGFEEACQAHGIDPQSAALRVERDHTGWISNVATRLRDAQAVFAETDRLALEVLMLAAGLGRRPGTDLAVLGCGNEPIGATLRPGLSTIDLSGEEIGRRATDTALQRISGSRMDAPQVVLVPPRFVARETTPAGAVS